MPTGENAQQKKWREEDDARTLAEAEVIKNDKKRMKGAARGASRLAEEKQTEADALRKFSIKRTEKNSADKKRVYKKK